MTEGGTRGKGEDQQTLPDTPAPEVRPPAPQAPLLELRDGLPPVVSTDAELDAAVARLARGVGPVAVDAERASGYRYSSRAYLIQIRRRGTGTLLIDPLPYGDVPNEALAPLRNAVGEQEWVVHAASQDLPCMRQLGLRPGALFDTELAGRLLNFPRVGLAVMVEELLGYSMRKEHSAVDWSRRPLPQAWLVYAALDVEMLLELRDALAERLAAAGKADWARQEFEMWAQVAPASPRRDPWRRTSGIHRVRGRRALAIVRELWTVRDEIGQSRDLAPGKILRDAAIVEAARAAPTTPAALARLPGFTDRARRYERQFFEAVRRALALPERDLPTTHVSADTPPPARLWKSRFPEAAARLAACRAAVLAVSAQVAVPAENLVDPEALRRLAWSPPGEPDVPSVTAALQAAGARPWQVDLAAQRLAQALAGQPGAAT